MTFVMTLENLNWVSVYFVDEVGCSTYSVVCGERNYIHKVIILVMFTLCSYSVVAVFCRLVSTFH